MYSKYLTVFISVAGSGSFNKAAEKLFITPNAVMKQMNLFEQELGFRLFVRSHH